MPISRKKRRILKAKWLVRVSLVNGIEHSFTLSIEDIRQYIAESKDYVEQSASEVGIINKYIFPCIIKRFENKPFKAIKVRGNYE